MCPNVRYPGTVRFPGFFCCVKSKVIYEFSMWKLEKNLSVRENTEKFKIEKSDQRCQNGAKKKVQELEQEKEYLTAANEELTAQIAESREDIQILKEQNQMKWIRLMNNIKASAEEIVLKNMVYV